MRRKVVGFLISLLVMTWVVGPMLGTLFGRVGLLAVAAWYFIGLCWLLTLDCSRCHCLAYEAIAGSHTLPGNTCPRCGSPW